MPVASDSGATASSSQLVPGSLSPPVPTSASPVIWAALAPSTKSFLTQLRRGLATPRPTALLPVGGATGGGAAAAAA